MFNRFSKGASLAVLGALSLGMMTQAALADEFSISANTAFTTDYVFRGISQSDQHFAVQGGFDASYGMLYAGTWASSIDFEGLADVELDVYAGIKPTLGPINMDFGVIGYFYPGANDAGIEQDFVEFKAGASTSPVENLTLGGTVFYSPEYNSEYGKVWTLQANAAYTLPKFGEVTPTLSATLGDVIGESGSGVFGGEDSYLFWNVGSAFNYDKFTLDLRYWDTNGNDAMCDIGNLQCDARFVATFSAAF